MDAIDDLVETATTSGANLISSAALRTTIQTTQFGGRITVSPQPLDSAGLGIKDLDGMTVEAAAASLARIETALNLARARVDNLEVPRNGLIPGGGVAKEIIRLLNSGSFAFLPRGSLINEIA